MKRSISFAIAPVVLLAACCEVAPKHGLSGEDRLENGFDLTTTSAPNPHQPNVFVIGGTLVVDQEPIVIPYPESPVTIAWALPAGTGFAFPRENAISVNDRKISDFRCQVNGKAAKSVKCSYSVKEKGLVKYTIRVNSPDNEVLELDPDIDNWHKK